ncbi:hypothetical protein [Saccharicrinis aurantiacus]|uniref:hypothetical protein n=1 Tax=Saccharicrinis aurantiacus TaxID=1849719 RepID=UPI00094FCDBD|nr:hypothetical protein [Saccharicrinis aurantiacus]
MTALSPNTVSKLYYFDSRIKSFYEKNGYTSLPFDGEKVQEMIDDSRLELNALFYKIWGSTMGFHLLSKFYSSNGNIYELFMSLDPENKEKFTTINW